MFEYKLIRSKRKTLSAQVLRDGTVLVRAPLFCTKAHVDRFILEKNHLIERYRAEIFSAPPIPLITRTDALLLKREAMKKILPRVGEISKSSGLSYEGAKITLARHRFGSCSAKNHLCFSAFLMLAQDNEIDYVIIHELCHTREHNHSRAFYDLVSGFLPDWKLREQNLRKIIIPEIVD